MLQKVRLKRFKLELLLVIIAFFFLITSFISVLSKQDIDMRDENIKIKEAISENEAIKLRLEMIIRNNKSSYRLYNYRKDYSGSYYTYSDPLEIKDRQTAGEVFEYLVSSYNRAGIRMRKGL